MFYDRFYIQNYGTKKNLEYMLTGSLPREKFKLFFDLMDVRTRNVPSALDGKKGKEVLI